MIKKMSSLWTEDACDLSNPAAVTGLLARGLYWNALSCFFEGNFHYAASTPAGREMLCDFVKKNFPREIKVQLRA